METIELKAEVLSKKEKILFEKEECNVKASFYWDSHGKLIPWENEEGKKNIIQKNCKVKVNQLKQKIDYGFDKPYDIETWTLYVNGKEIEGDVNGYNYNPNTNTINLKLILGWG